MLVSSYRESKLQGNLGGEIRNGQQTQQHVQIARNDHSSGGRIVDDGIDTGFEEQHCADSAIYSNAHEGQTCMEIWSGKPQ